MARIRTIKPEFPQSESMGRVSRDARLCFIMIWTICDDAGRVRGNSRMLASLLYPYDDDAPKLMGKWLDELEREGCIRRYKIGTDTYLESLNWLKHQKIDKPSISRIPPFSEASRSLANSREASATDLVPSTLDLVSGPRPRTMDLSSSADASPALEEAVSIYNLEAKENGWPQCQVLSAPRKRAIAGRLSDCGGLEGWRTAIDRAAKSDFLAGRSERTNGHESWTMDFDFLVKPANFTKLMEGKYDNRSNGSKPKGFAAALAGAKLSLVPNE